MPIKNVQQLGWTEAVNSWTGSVSYLLRTAEFAGKVMAAEDAAIQQILSSSFTQLEANISHGDEATPARRKSRSKAPSGALQRIAICGNPERSGDLKPAALEAVTACARVLSRYSVRLVHGPRGAGIMVANQCHNEFQSRSVSSELVFVDRERIVKNADLVIVIGGGFMTGVEVDIAAALRLSIAAIPGTGGVADQLAERIRAGHDSVPVEISMLANIDGIDQVGPWLTGVMKNGFRRPDQEGLQS